MQELTFIQQTFTSLQAASQLVKALIGVRDTALIESKMIELRDHIIEAQNGMMQSQTQQSALIQEVHALKQQIMKMEAWNKEKQRYQLVSPWPGCYVFALKESAKGFDPPHWICANCYEKGSKEYLHFAEIHDRCRRNIVKCAHCSFQSERKNWDDAQYAERYAEKQGGKAQPGSG